MPDCKGTPGKVHNALVLSFISYTWVEFVYSIDGIGGFEEGTIEIYLNVYPSYPPGPWCETNSALQYYQQLQKSLQYSDRSYAEAVDFGWHRTVRALYPDEISVLDVERVYRNFMSNEGLYMEKGIKDGTKAAVKAFITYKGSSIPIWL